MDLRRIVFATITLLFFSPAFSQKATLNGYITDKKTGERLLGASVFIQNKNLGTTSNNFGFYSITLPLDSVEVVFSFSGYTSQSQKFYLGADTTLDIGLQQAQELTEVMVKASRKPSIQ